MDEQIPQLIEKALASGDLHDTAAANLRRWLNAEGMPEWVGSSITQLAGSGEWGELNDRFHKNLAFGTGGMRGRTIGRIATDAERGSAKSGDTPAHAAVGSNTLNDYTVVRATMALHRFARTWMAREGILDVPRVVIAHDVRHFSRHFCELAASTWGTLGGYAMIFDGPRSTPQLSYTVRLRYAHAGIVITASHNPPHDNGFKAYFVDGAQIVPPHDEAIVERYGRITLQETIPFVKMSAESQDTAFTILPTSDDLAYRAILEEAVLDAETLKGHCPKIVFTPIHGTGGISAIPALWDHGVEVASVDGQTKPDPNFPTVKSPNPENPEAFKQGIAVARKIKAKAVIATDPDGDRIGVAVFDGKGNYHCISGNQIGCMLAEYRISKLKKLGILPDAGSSRAVILKTFVTTPMLEEIARVQGIRCVNTLTGFKWMAEKLADYEDAATAALREQEGISWEYGGTDFLTRAEILLRYSNFTVLAAEESHGYLPLDIVRDKDGNASALAFAEMLAHLNSIGSTPLDFLENLYGKYGYFEENTANFYFEGATGADVIRNIIESYSEKTPSEINGVLVRKAKNFGRTGYLDEDEKPLAIENFFMFELENDYTVAVRASGTEPKIKYYLFGRAKVSSRDSLAGTKNEVGKNLEALAKWAKVDANERGGVVLEANDNDPPRESETAEKEASEHSP
ncbi:MAG: phospho-sugar mutase [Opitutales bacterium]